MLTHTMPITAPVVTFDRHRMRTDGEGVTTLVGFYGCPLRCRYCINAFSFAPQTKRTMLTPQELYDKVKCDDLYFCATGGGVTFGGGEPLLYAPFLKAFRALCQDRWRLCVETSLAVSEEAVRLAADCIDCFYVDCKDTDADTYYRYTGGDVGTMRKNLALLLSLVDPEKVVVRVPHIPAFNTQDDCERSEKRLRDMGVLHIERFTYRVDQ